MLRRSLPFVFAVCALLAGCAPSGAGQGTVEAPPPEVTAARVSLHDIADWAEFTGRIEASSRVDVRPRVGGYVESLHFDEGGRVEAGDLLFRIDARPFRAAVARLAAEVERARAESAIAATVVDRSRRLLAENATSHEEHERVEADLAIAQATLDAAEAALDAAQLDLAFTEVTAPYAGRVSRALVKPGQLVDPSIALTRLVADDPVHAYFDVDEHTWLELLQNHEGLAVDVGLANESGYPHAASLDFIDNEIDAEHGTIRLRAALENADGRFTPGLFARVRVVGARTYRAALVDERAIGTDLDRKYVLVVDAHGIAQYRPVELGRAVDGLRIVKSGLDAGERVIVNGLQRVRPGAPVAATETDMNIDSPLLARLVRAARRELAIAAGR